MNYFGLLKVYTLKITLSHSLTYHDVKLFFDICTQLHSCIVVNCPKSYENWNTSGLYFNFCSESLFTSCKIKCIMQTAEDASHCNNCKHPVTLIISLQRAYIVLSFFLSLSSIASVLRDGFRFKKFLFIPRLYSWQRL